MKKKKKNHPTHKQKTNKYKMSLQLDWSRKNANDEQLDRVSLMLFFFCLFLRNGLFFSFSPFLEVKKWEILRPEDGEPVLGVQQAVQDPRFDAVLQSDLAFHLQELHLQHRCGVPDAQAGLARFKREPGV
jgi:hypothetical protein